MYSKITLFVVCCLFFSSCFFKSDKELQIGFSTDSSAIVCSGLDEVNRYRAEQAFTNDSLMAQLVTVVQIADDQAIPEKTMKGKLILKDKDLFFFPDTPFVKGQRYLVNTFLGASFGKAKDILKSDLGHSIKDHQKILQR